MKGMEQMKSTRKWKQKQEKYLLKEISMQK